MNLKKHIIIHFHIFKNAGTTLEEIFKKNFGDNAISKDTGDPRGILSWAKVFSHLINYPEVKAFSSHQIRFPIPDNSDFSLLPFVLLRHPIDRAFSMYIFDKKRKNLKNQIMIEKAHNLTIKEYFKWNIENKKHRGMKNFQVRCLSGKAKNLETYRDDLQLAIELLNDCTVIGTVDRFDETMTLAEETLRPFFENIDCTYVIKNVNEERKRNLDERLEQARIQIGDSLMNQLEEVNRMDLELYSKTNEVLDNRIKEVPGFDEKLSLFKKRCKNNLDDL